jgi:hypothetical protein
MFDTMTAADDVRKANAAAIVSEAARVLRRPAKSAAGAAAAAAAATSGAEKRLSGGEYIIFSTFGPNDPVKSTLALLRSSIPTEASLSLSSSSSSSSSSSLTLSVEVEELRDCGPPFEIPDQPFPFLYRLRRL